ncbi:3-keto-disaccharide hydrolase [Singulisphaera rosea]
MIRLSRTWGAVAGLLVLSLAITDRPAATAAPKDGEVPLFNGKDLSGWRGNKAYWSVEDGALTGKTTPTNLLAQNTFLIWEGTPPPDFELRFHYKIVGGNSGVQYRSRVIDDALYVVGGYQADIDSSPKYTGMNYEERGRTFLAQRGEKVEIAPDGSKKVVASLGNKDELQAKVKNEDWNEYIIIAKRNHLTHIVNGVTMSEVTDNQKDKAATTGILAIQLHQGPPMTVQLKDFQLKALE